MEQEIEMMIEQRKKKMSANAKIGYLVLLTSLSKKINGVDTVEWYEMNANLVMMYINTLPKRHQKLLNLSALYHLTNSNVYKAEYLKLMSE